MTKIKIRAILFSHYIYYYQIRGDKEKMKKVLKTTAIALVIFSLLNAEEIPDPCTLLTQQEAETLLQVPVQPGRLRDEGRIIMGLTCTYYSQDMIGKPGTISIMIDTTKSMKKNGSIYESAKDEYYRILRAHTEAMKEKHLPVHKISGLGDDAFWLSPKLTVIYKDTYFTITAHPHVTTMGTEPWREKAEAVQLSVSKSVAKLVLQRLSENK